MYGRRRNKGKKWRSQEPVIPDSKEAVAVDLVLDRLSGNREFAP